MSVTASADDLFEQAQRQCEREDFDGAADTFVRGYRLLDKLAETYGFLPEIQSSRAGAAACAANCYVEIGNGDAAQEWIAVALPIAAELERKYPDQPSLDGRTLRLAQLLHDALEVSDEPDPVVVQAVLRWFNESVESTPSDIELLTAQGILQLELEEFGGALESFDGAIAAGEELFARRGDSIPIQSRLGGNYHNRAMAYAGLGNFAAARNDYLTALKHQSAAFEAQPDVPQHREFLRNHHLNLGLLLAGAGEPEEALTHYEAGLDLMPDDPEIKLQMADVLAELKRYDEVVPLLEAVVAADDSNVNAVLLLSFSYTLVEQYDDALNVLEPLRNGNSPLPDAHFHAGMAEFRRQDFAAAAEAFERALELNLSHRGWALFHLALCYAQLDRPDDATAAYEQLKEIDPDMADDLYEYLSAPSQPPPPVNVFTI